MTAGLVADTHAATILENIGEDDDSVIACPAAELPDGYADRTN